MLLVSQLFDPNSYPCEKGFNIIMGILLFTNPLLGRSFFAHLSRRLMGELIGYPCSVSVRCRMYVRQSSSSTISNIFSETACPIKDKFYVEPPWIGGTKFCPLHLGHMTKMAAMPIYGENPSKIFFSGIGRQIFTKLCM